MPHPENLQEVADRVREHLAKAVEMLPPPDPGTNGLNGLRLSLARALRFVDSPLAADELLQAILATNPKHHQARLERVNCAFDSKNFDAAIEILDSILEKKPNDAQILTRKADALLRLGKSEQAIFLLEKVRDKHPESVPALQMLARVQKNSGDRIAAYGTYFDLLQIEPDHHGALLGRIDLAIVGRQFESALEQSERALRIYPEDIGFVIRKARAQQLSGQPRAAAKMLGDCLAQNPGEESVEMALARTLVASGEHSRANDIYEDVLSRFPSHRGALLGQISVALESGDNDAALEAGERALDQYPDDLEILSKQGIAMNRAGRADEAVRLLEKLASTNSGNLSLQMELARAHLAVGNHDAADRVYQDVIKRNPNHEAALLGRVAAAEAKGDFAGAKQLIEARLKMDKAQILSK